MKRKGLLFVCLWLLIALCLPVQAKAAVYTPLSDFEYTLQSTGTVLLTRYTGADPIVSVPDSYEIGGISYPVELSSKTVFGGNTRITSVSLCEGVRFAECSMAQLFAQCSKLCSVEVKNLNTAPITDMSYMFYGCEKLEKLNLSGWDTGNVITMEAMFSGCKLLTELTGYTQWHTASLLDIRYMFIDTAKLNRIDLRQWKLSQLINSAWCFQLCGAEEILLPEDIAVISAGFFNHAADITGKRFTLPAGVKTVGYAHTFYDFGTEDFSEFVVSPDNTAYQAIDGILYSADGTQLLAIPRAKHFPGGVYTVPEGVTFMAELSFSRNYNIREVVLPDSYVLKSALKKDPEYITYEDIGNLNAGLNLNIAIYAYTGVTKYTVKQTNPHYRSIDGILYSRDLTTLVAVPTRFDGYLEIPEGVTTWHSDAMWCAGEAVDAHMKNCKGVSIPSTLTDIAYDQLAKLNRLQRNAGLRISVSKDNPVYYLSKDGYLTKRAHFADLQILLDADSFVYDGTAKTPAVQILYEKTSLIEGKDYTLVYVDNINAGTGKVRITGNGKFYGTVERFFTIAKAQPEYVSPSAITAIYGQRLQQLPLPAGFSWEEPMALVGAAGTHTPLLCYSNGDPNYATVPGIPITVCVKAKEVQFVPQGLLGLYPWTGNPIEPSVTVMDGTNVVPAEEYSLTYEKNTALGTAVIRVADVDGGNYTVTGSLEFLIVPGPLIVTVPLIGLLTALAAVLHKRRLTGKKAEQ